METFSSSLLPHRDGNAAAAAVEGRQPPSSSSSSDTDIDVTAKYDEQTSYAFAGENLHTQAEKYHSELHGVTVDPSTNYDDSSVAAASPESPHRRRGHRLRVINPNTLGWKWVVWAVLADVFAAAGSVAGLYELAHGDFETSQEALLRRLLLGVTAFMSSTLFVSYSRHMAQLYFFIEAMYNAVPHIALFAVSVLPIFFGYALFGIIVFSPYCREFADFDYACATLISMTFGDSLLQVFTDLNATRGYVLAGVARIYTGSFILMFICVVLNIMLSIVQRSYYLVKRKFRVLKLRQKDKALRALKRNLKIDSARSAMASRAGFASEAYSPPPADARRETQLPPSKDGLTALRGDVVKLATLLQSWASEHGDETARDTEFREQS